MFRFRNIKKIYNFLCYFFFYEMIEGNSRGGRSSLSCCVDCLVSRSYTMCFLLMLSNMAAPELQIKHIRLSSTSDRALLLNLLYMHYFWENRMCCVNLLFLTHVGPLYNGTVVMQRKSINFRAADLAVSFLQFCIGFLNFQNWVLGSGKERILPLRC